MASAMERYLELIHSQLGYKETGTNQTKYGKFFDTPKADGGAWQYFNTHKQGSEWCSLLIHWAIYKLFGEKKTRKLLNEPSAKNNCGAGVKYLWNYLSAAKRTFKRGEKTPKRGDIIFFGNLSHVGTVTNVKNSRVYTEEGNSGNAVKEHSYALTNKKIYGYARLDWSIVEESKPKPTPSDKKETVKATQSAESFDTYYARSYKVTRDVLNIRDGASTDYKSLVKMKKDDKCRCYGYFTNNWLYVRYENSSAIYEGFVSKNYLTAC